MLSTHHTSSGEDVGVKSNIAPPAGALAAVSQKIATIEGRLAGVLVFLIFILLLGNVLCRAIGVPLIWADELAVLLMAWVAFIGASMGLAYQQHIAVTLLPDAVTAGARRRLALLVHVLLLVFFAVLSVQLWGWFDPVSLWRAGSIEAFSAAAFNFIYQEPTITLGVPKFLFWLVLPIFCVTSVIHLASSLMANYKAAEAME
jgi:TRAP-type C4-dicarboxylate transport system permease small subunit